MRLQIFNQSFNKKCSQISSELKPIDVLLFLFCFDFCLITIINSRNVSYKLISITLKSDVVDCISQCHQTKCITILVLKIPRYPPQDKAEPFR